jgi:2-polyprenyl-3-methyl-5-hydroxy-6-metoxy-1,4-benzoquinol methylase
MQVLPISFEEEGAMVAFTKNMFQSELAKYYDVMHQHRNYGQECHFADNLIQKYCPGTKYILDICCGTGEHAIQMAKLGYKVTGIDASPDMIKLAKEKAKKVGASIEFSCINIHELNVIGEFQAAYCLGYTFHYMTTYSDVMSFLHTINKALLPKGLFLVDFINGWSLIEGINRDKFVYQREDATIFHFEQASLNRKKRVRHIEFYYVIDCHDGHVKTISAEEDLRIFFDDEVQMLLSTCGFEKIKSFGDYTLDTKASGVPDIIIVAGQKGASERGKATKPP